MVSPIVNVYIVLFECHQNGPGITGNERVFSIPKNSRTGESLSDGLLPYPGHSLREGYLSA